MRQAGIIAAGSLHAFENHIERLPEDHERARKLAHGLREAGYTMAPPETNIVLLESKDPAGLIEALGRAGVLATLGSAPAAGRPGTVRLCTHLDVDDADVEDAVEAAVQVAVAGAK